jgi:hypothetical protein
MKTRLLIASIFLTFGSVSAFAQPVAATTQRDVNQQTRIEHGLKDGQLTIKEAGRLENEQSRIDRLQAKDLKDGKLTPRERAQLTQAQNKASHDIKMADTNAAKGNPDSKSSERMQADIQRNVNQQTRIEQGVKSGSLTRQEVGHLERGQARVDHEEGIAAKNGHISNREQALIQKGENKQNKRIFNKKHNAAVASQNS